MITLELVVYLVIRALQDAVRPVVVLMFASAVVNSFQNGKLPTNEFMPIATFVFGFYFNKLTAAIETKNGNGAPPKP